MPANKLVNIIIYVVVACIPFLYLYAFYRIKKLRKILIVAAVFPAFALLMNYSLGMYDSNELSDFAIAYYELPLTTQWALYYGTLAAWYSTHVLLIIK